MLSLLAVGRNFRYVKPYCFFLQLLKPVHKIRSAFPVKAASDVLQCLIIKMLDQPVILIIHLQVYDNIRILFEIHLLHLKHFFPQKFKLP